MRRVLAAAVLALGVLAASAPTAGAEERTCRGSIGRVTVDNLRVPDRATCRLKGTYVKGTIKVETSATLDARYVRVVGNVQAEEHRAVTLVYSRVGGSVQLKQGGSAVVSRNAITGDLQCKSNVPAPTGGGNIVGGNKEDQCARL
jgi:hypothetical protein